MSRPMTTELKWHLRKPVYRFATLCEVEHPDGTVYLWSGTGTLLYDDKEWKGVGHIAAITGIEETSEVVVSEVQLVLTNVPESELNAVNIDWKGLQANVRWAALTEDLRVIRDPLLLATIDLDHSKTRTEEDGTHTVVISGQTGFWVLEQPSNISWTTEEQQLEFSADTGFDLIPGLVDEEIIWTPT